MMLQSPPGTMDQATFAHRLYQNFIDVIDVCLKCEMQKREVDYMNPAELTKNLNKYAPPGNKDLLVGTFLWDKEELISVERHDGRHKHSWGYVIKSASIGDQPKQEAPTIVYS